MKKFVKVALLDVKERTDAQEIQSDMLNYFLLLLLTKMIEKQTFDAYLSL